MPTASKRNNGADTAAKNLESISAAQQEALDGFMEISQTIFNGMVAYNRELTNFIAGRVAEDIETQQQFLHCKSLTDVLKVQSAFIEKAMGQYSDEAEKLAKIGTDAVREDLETVSRHVGSNPKRRTEARRKSA